jgi:hypothetical protein
MTRPYWLIVTQRRNDAHPALSTYWTLERAQEAVEALLRNPDGLRRLRLTESQPDAPERVVVDWKPT